MLVRGGGGGATPYKHMNTKFAVGFTWLPDYACQRATPRKNEYKIFGRVYMVACLCLSEGNPSQTYEYKVHSRDNMVDWLCLSEGNLLQTYKYKLYPGVFIYWLCLLEGNLSQTYEYKFYHRFTW